MNQILESGYIALGAIWANKLRSFMTVLGNIVAVTSIVTVVSLIQGMNAMVSNAIVADVGADAPPPVEGPRCYRPPPSPPSVPTRSPSSDGLRFALPRTRSAPATIRA